MSALLRLPVRERAEWRLGRGWSAAELAQRLEALTPLPVTAGEAIAGGTSHHSQAVIAREPPGPPLPGGSFTRAQALVRDYQFSDPSIVRGHFDQQAPLLGRRMLLEIQVWGQHYLCGVVVGAVRDERDEERTAWGYRYDTLAGHLEAGAEWFLLTKDHASGEIHFRIEARWREGQFPSWWSRVGFAVLARRYQRAWHRRAYLRLRHGLGVRDLPDPPQDGRRGARPLIVHTE
jgi:uncharacterized protein (UPF0548 family)